MVRPTDFKVERGPIADGTCRLSIAGELDLATTPKLEDEVNKALLGGARMIEIDLVDLDFIDSTGLRLFLQLNERAATDGFSLLMVRPSRAVRTLLRITGSGDELPIGAES